MSTIWKFPFTIQDNINIEMPANAKLLCVQVQGDTPCIWAIVNPTYKKEVRKFRCYGTGHPFNSALAASYVGTFQVMDGSLVFHLFENLFS